MSSWLRAALGFTPVDTPIAPVSSPFAASAHIAPIDSVASPADDDDQEVIGGVAISHNRHAHSPVEPGETFPSSEALVRRVHDFAACFGFNIARDTRNFSSTEILRHKTMLTELQLMRVGSCVTKSGVIYCNSCGKTAIREENNKFILTFSFLIKTGLYTVSFVESSTLRCCNLHLMAGELCAPYA